MHKAGIVGCGMIAGAVEDPAAPGTYSHAKAYRSHPAFGELGLVDRHPERAEALARKYSGTAFPDVAALLAGLRPDVVSVCVPDDLHFAVLREVLTSPHRPRLVFAEKPVCSTRAELDELVRLERAAEARVVVNHTRRFCPAHRRLRELVRGGTLGGLLRGQVDYYGGFRHLGVHVVDLLQFLFGTALTPAELRPCCASKYADDPTLDGTLLLGSAPVRLSGVPESHYQVLDISLFFERGQVKLTDFGKRVEVLRRTVNAERENVLELDAALSGPGLESPIKHAVAALAAALGPEGPAALDEFGLDEARRTMETLWRGSELYANQS